MDTLEGNGRRGPTTSIREDAMKGYVGEQPQDVRKVSKATPGPCRVPNMGMARGSI